MPSDRFTVVCADPPWAFSDRLKKMKAPTKRSAESQYPVLDVEAIKALNIKDLADPDGSVLALWVPSTMLIDGLGVMSAWGYTFKQTFVWVKTKVDAIDRIRKCSIGNIDGVCSFGMGRTFRQSHEIALIGTMGKAYSRLKNKSQRSVVLEHNKGHSIKPEALQDRLELMFPGTKMLELFARRQRPGWMCLGNDIDGLDIRESVQSLLEV